MAHMTHDPRHKAWFGVAWEGAKKTTPIAVSSGLFGILYGAACISLGMSADLAVASSVLVFSGAVQFAGLGMLSKEISMTAIGVSAFLVSIRFVLMGASIADYLKDRPLWLRILSMPILTDGNWAATVSERRKLDFFPFFVGGGVWVLSWWAAGTFFGTLIAGAVSDALIASLRFSGVLFLALLLLLVVRNARIGHAPWMISAVVALAGSSVLPLALAFLLGVGAGGIFAWFRADPERLE